MSINARFEHLSSGQRNEIYRAVHGVGSTFGEGGNYYLLLHAPERKTMVRRMARRFGVTQRTIERVYIHLLNVNHRRLHAQRTAFLAEAKGLL